MDHKKLLPKLKSNPWFWRNNYKKPGRLDNAIAAMERKAKKPK
jgi:hypothetical protein